jgi:hypothetical protein
MVMTASVWRSSARHARGGLARRDDASSAGSSRCPERRVLIGEADNVTGSNISTGPHVCNAASSCCVQDDRDRACQERADNAAAQKRVRCTLAAEAPSGGVATALPTSSRRDCTSASCARAK